MSPKRFFQAYRHHLQRLALSQSASALAYATLLAIVPMLAITLTLISGFPVFARMRATIEGFLVGNLLPPDVANTISAYLNQFTSRASTLSAVGLAFLGVTIFTMVRTLERVLNEIWGVTPHRPLVQRLLVFWAILTAGPMFLAMGVSVSVQLYGLTSGLTKGWVDHSALRPVLLVFVSFSSSVLAMTLLYRLIPEAPVRWRDALLAAALCALVLELAKRLFGGFIASGATYKTIYGTLAALPVFLLWLYVSWWIVLLGAVFAAVLPMSKEAVLALPEVPGARWALAETLLDRLVQSHELGAPLSELQAAQSLSLDPAIVTETLELLREDGYCARLDDGEHWALLRAPDRLDRSAVKRRLLIDTEALRADGRLRPLAIQG